MSNNKPKKTREDMIVQLLDMGCYSMVMVSTGLGALLFSLALAILSRWVW